MDGRHTALEPEPVSPTSSVVVDIPAGPMNKANGSIQIWPGTHKIRPPDGGPSVPNELESAREAVEGPLQPETDIGDVLIRDTRLWHRGVPNASNRPRHMIALIVSEGRSPSKAKLRFETGCEAALEGHDVDANAEYFDESLEYLIGPTRRIYEHRRAAQESRNA